MPLPKGGEAPPIAVERGRDGLKAVVTHPDGTVDEVVVDSQGRPGVFRRRGEARLAFGWSVNELRAGGRTVKSGDVPFHGALRLDGELSGKLTLGEPGKVEVEGEGAFELHPASYILAGGKLTEDRSEASLASNSVESQERLRAALSSWTERERAARDKYTAQGWRNVALKCEVSATGTRDARFGPEHVIDNKVCEFPADGLLDYTQGPIMTTQGYGYSVMEHMSYFAKQSEWPFYVRPTYWLLPPRSLGEITLKLPEPMNIKLVRVLNTTNGGLNDYATVDFHVDLLDENAFPAWTAKRRFGRPWDRVFKAAFAIPEYFGSYGAAFEGILEPGVTVPFGAGWVDVPVDFNQRPISYVRITVDSFWAMGGGINEIQVYPAE